MTDSERYEHAAHAMQTGVAMMITMEEFAKILADQMEEEAESYRKLISERTCANVNLI